MGQPGLHHLHVTGFAKMRGTSKREVNIAQGKSIGCAGFDQRQALDKLGRRPRVDRQLRHTSLMHHRARLCLHHHVVAALNRLDAIGAGCVNQWLSFLKPLRC